MLGSASTHLCAIWVLGKHHAPRKQLLSDLQLQLQFGVPCRACLLERGQIRAGRDLGLFPVPAAPEGIPRWTVAFFWVGSCSVGRLWQLLLLRATTDLWCRARRHRWACIAVPGLRIIGQRLNMPQSCDRGVRKGRGCPPYLRQGP